MAAGGGRWIAAVANIFPLAEKEREMLGVRQRDWLPILLLLAVAWPAFAADEKPAAGEKPIQEKAVPSAPAENADRFAVPEGTPKDLVAFITKLITGPAPRDMETVQKMRKSILDAAEKILAAKPNEQENAILKEADKIRAAKPNDQEKTIFKDADKIRAAKANDQEVEFAVQAKMNMLQNRQQLADFTAELQKGGQDKLARQVRGFMLQIDLRKQMNEGGGPAAKKPVEESLKFLQEAQPQASDITLAYTAGLLAELSGDKELANKTYDTMAKVFAASKDAKLAEFATVLQGVVRRLNLVGQEMKLEGKTLDGAAFDWAKYRGKVVAVEFWATNYPSCLREIRDLKKYYESYHDKGLEIVGISLDRKPADVTEFVKANAIPWPIIGGEGKPNPGVIYYGIMSLPTTILVGKDGKVVAVSPRGEALGKELEKFIGPAEKKAEPAATPEVKTK
jgi:peroxiredoxin